MCRGPVSESSSREPSVPLPVTVQVPCLLPFTCVYSRLIEDTDRLMRRRRLICGKLETEISLSSFSCVAFLFCVEVLCSFRYVSGVRSALSVAGRATLRPNVVWLWGSFYFYINCTHLFSLVLENCVMPLLEETLLIQQLLVITVYNFLFVPFSTSQWVNETYISE